MENTSNEIVDNKLLRRIADDRDSAFANNVDACTDEELKKIARQFGDAEIWDPLVKETAAYIISYMYAVIDMSFGVEPDFETSDLYDEYVDSYFHLVTRGREEFQGEVWFDTIVPIIEENNNG